MPKHALAPPRARRRRSPVAIAAAAAALGTMLALNQPVRDAAVGPATSTGPAAATAPGLGDGSDPDAGPSPDTCAAMVARLPLRDRLAQRLMVGVDPAAPDAARTLVRQTHVGGVFVGGNAIAILHEPVLRQVRAAGPVPLAVAVDDEGGRVQRIDGLVGSIPSARRMGTMPVAEVRALARERGIQLRAIGIDIDFAPVLDVGDQPDGAVIGDRSFSSDPQVVAAHAGAWADGLRDAAVVPVFKHFPGHGRADGDSHRVLPTTPPLDDLRAVDLKPYAQVLGGGQAGVMVGHLNVPGLTDGLPASLSPNAYRLLRADYGFAGVTVTDDLGGMLAVSAHHTVVDAVAVALEAGADMALWTSAAQVASVIDNLVRLSDSGRLPVAGTDAAVGRILRMKGLCTSRPTTRPTNEGTP